MGASPPKITATSSGDQSARGVPPRARATRELPRTKSCCATGGAVLSASAVLLVIAAGALSAFLFANSLKAPWRHALHGHLHGVVLIINFNFAEHTAKTAPFLRALYGPFFLSVVPIAPSSVPAVGVRARSADPFAKKWFGSYLAIEKILLDFPEAEGFLWISDDVALNYWHLIGANTSNIWVRRYQGLNFPFDAGQKTNVSDAWAGDIEHRNSARLAFEAMGANFQKQFLNSMLPHSGVYPKRVIDAFFLPRPHAITLSRDLIPVFRRHRVWWEIALPMMLFAVEHPSSYDGIFDDMVYRWEHRGEHGEAYDPLKYWTWNVSALHPWKLSSLKSRIRLLEAFSFKDPCVLTLNSF